MDKDEKLALVFSGGSAMGIFQIGAYEVLHSSQKFASLQILSGTSAGAINSALIAYGYLPAEIYQFWVEVGQLFYKEISLQLLGNLFSRPFLRLFGRQYNYLFKTQKMRALLVRYFKGEALPLLEKTLILNMVDAKTGGVVRISNQKTSHPDYIYEPNISVDSILASASIPVLFSPVSRFGTLLWDGGLLVNTPLAPAAEFGATTIIPILCSVPEAQSDISTLGNALGQMANIVLDRSYDLDRKLLIHKNKLVVHGEENYHHINLYQPVRPNSSDHLGAWASFNYTQKNLNALYAMGKREATQWLKTATFDT